MAQKQATPTQQFIDISEIRGGTVVLKNGGLRKVVLVAGINFDLKSNEEQEVITFAYQNFLNSLDFPFQIAIHSRKLNIDGYLARLEKRQTDETNELIRNQLGEYITFVRSFVESNAIMQKTFFVVVPFTPIALPSSQDFFGKLFGGGKKQAPKNASFSRYTDEEFERHNTQLNQRVDQVVSGLRSIGLRSLSLEDAELVELLYNYYNPATVERKEFTIASDEEDRVNLQDFVAPAAAEITSHHLKLGDKLGRSFFVFNYPRYLTTGWFTPVLNLSELLDISLFINPVDTTIALRNLRRKSTQLQAQISEIQEKGLIRDPMLETALQDVEALRDSLQQSTEKLFNVSAYFTVYADTEKELNRLESELTSLLENRLVYIKPAHFQQLDGFRSTIPLGSDHLNIHAPLNSGPLSSFFPFASPELTSDEGVLYGVNRHNNTLIIFDRFSLENANTVVFAKAGSGKSYAAKLEILRSLMLGTDIIIIDPENEYLALAEAVGGSVFKISLDSDSHVNPLDIPIIPEDEEPNEVLKSHIVNLTGLIKLMLGKMTPAEEAVLDRALTETYASRGITPDKDFKDAKAPLLEDLETVLKNMDGGKGLAERLHKYTKGSYAGFTNSATNIQVRNRLIVFSIRDLEKGLRPIAMYIILNYIWNIIRAELKKRILVIDEGWWMMQYEDSASFLLGLAKRARKYYLGITTITQDVEDFLASPYGRPIITNSSLQLLLKQSPAATEAIQKAFNLTEVEKNYLLEADIGQGLFFAGLKQAAIQIVGSYFEDKLITTNPEQILQQKKGLQDSSEPL